MIQIAILGLGTVGTGVAKVVAENARQIERKLGEPLQVKAVLVRHFKDGPYRQLMTDDFKKIEEDGDIRVVVETIGGVEAAYAYTKRALAAGKHSLPTSSWWRSTGLNCCPWPGRRKFTSMGRAAASTSCTVAPPAFPTTT